MQLKMTHSAVIERNSGTGDTDSWGQPVTSGWENHLDGQPCRAWVTLGHETVADTTTVVVVEDIRMLLPLGVDVTEQDRVASVADRGATILAGPLQIRAVLAHQDHLELVLVKVA